MQDEDFIPCLEIDAQIAIQPAGASTAAMVNVFVSADGGSTWKLFDQIAMAAATGSASVKSTRNIGTYSNLSLPGTAYSLGVTTTVSQATAVCALMKKINKTLKTSIVLVDSSKAPKGAVGAKWVAVSYRIDGFKTRG